MFGLAALFAGISQGETMTEEKNRFGIDRLQVMLKFIGILEGEDTRKQHEAFKAYIVKQIKRKLTKEETLGLIEGILKYIRSDEATNERMDAITYITDCEFLDPEQYQVRIPRKKRKKYEHKDHFEVTCVRRRKDKYLTDAKGNKRKFIIYYKTKVEAKINYE